MGKRFWWQWVLACIAAKLVQIVLDSTAVWGAQVSGPGRAGMTTILGFLILFRLFSGAIGGAFQWVVLKQWLPSSRSWVLATSVGGAIAFGLMQWLLALTSLPPVEGPLGKILPPQSALPEFVLAGFYGLVLGIAQWLVLRTKLAQAGWWVLASIVGFMLTSLGFQELERFLGGLLGQSGFDVSRGSWNPFFWGISALSTLFYAAVTGSFLLWSLRSDKPE